MCIVLLDIWSDQMYSSTMHIERDLYKKITGQIAGKEAVIITGMRRTGKTTLLKYIMEKLPSSNKLFLDLQNPVNQKLFSETDYDKIRSSLEALGIAPKERGYVFMDEIQLVPELPQAVKYLADNFGIKFFLTGSASFYLKNLFSESLSGRKYLYELFPLNFAEFLRLKAVRISLPVEGVFSETVFNKLSVLYDEYVEYGGFPEVILEETPAGKKAKLGDIFTSYYQLEVLRLGDFRKNSVVRDLMILLASRTGSKLEVSGLASDLGVSRITINEYLSFMESTYFIGLVRPYSRNKNSELKRMPKVYLADSGLANLLGSPEKGPLFENNVYQNLKLNGTVNYYEKKSGGEIDFILNGQKAYEVKSKPDARDAANLADLCKILKISDFGIVSRSYSEELKARIKIYYGFEV